VRPQRGERLPNDVEKYAHEIHPHASGEVRGGPGYVWARGLNPAQPFLSNI
jgi:hypothetical protein